MSATQLPFARRRTDGILVRPADVPRGAACDCECPGCAAPVIAKKGHEKAWHFAHTEGMGCSAGYERSVHEMAKQMLRAPVVLRLPPVVAVAREYRDDGTAIIERETLADERLVKSEGRVPEFAAPNVAPDAVLSVDGAVLLVEVVVFHRLSESKLLRLAETGIPCLLIDLGLFKNIDANAELLASELFDNPGNRSWAYHPGIPPLLEKLKQRIQERRDQARREREEAAERHRLNEERWAIQHQELMKRPRPPASRPEEPASPVPAAAAELVRWRAAFPPQAMINQARTGLATRIGCSLEQVEAVTSEVARRSDLNRFVPNELIQKWAAILNCAEDEILLYLLQAWFVIK